jgi:hypothetical protein
MPGWVYYIEPRGDRLITLGYERNEGGTLTVSQFDVSDPWNPTELARIPFGWGTVMAEDQSRIHKAMQVLDDRGLILVPYGARSSSFVQGVIQLFTFTHDTVTALSEVTLAGPARRAFFYGDDLIAFSSEQLAAWNLGDASAPQSLDRLDLVEPVYLVEAVGPQHVAVLTENAWTQKASLAIHDRADTQFQAPLAVIDLNAAGVLVSGAEQYYWTLPASNAFLFASGATLHLLYRDQAYGRTKLASFDLTDPAAPVLIQQSTLPGYVSPRDARRARQTSVEAGENAVLVNDTLVYRTNEQEGEYTHLVAVDVRDPAFPTLAHHLIPRAYYDPYNLGTLLVSGDHVYTSYFEFSFTEESETGDWVDYHLLDVDLSDPDAVRFIDAGLIPGSLVGLTPSRSEMVTVDYRREESYAASRDACYASGLYPEYDVARSLCYRIHHTLKISSFEDPMNGLIREIPAGEAWIRDVQVTQTRLFYTTYEESVYQGFPNTAPVGWFDRRPKLHAISLQDNPRWEESAVIELPHPYAFLYWAHGNHAVVVADAPPMLLHLRNPTPGTFENASEMALGGYLFDIIVDGDDLIFALGLQGPRTSEFLE